MAEYISQITLPNNNTYNLKDTNAINSVGYDSTNEKIYYTKNGSNTDIVTINTLKNAINVTVNDLALSPTIKKNGSAVTNLEANTTYTLDVGGQTVNFKTPVDTNTNTLVNYTIKQNNKVAYLMGCQDAPSDTTTARAAHGDKLVYLNTTAGELSAKSLSINDGANTPAEKIQLKWNPTDESLDFIFV